MDETNYLEEELTQLLRSDHSTWDFLRQGSLDGVWYWDLEQPENEWMSPEFWRLFGVDPATKRHLSSEWQDLIFPEDAQLALENFQRHCEDPGHPYDQVVRYRHADGSTVWVRCRGAAIRDASGKPIRMLGAHNDITAHKQAEERAEQARAEAERANEQLRTFAYSLSHELKSPSNTTRMLLDELETSDGDTLTEDGRHWLELAFKTVDRMRLLVDDLLRFTTVMDQETVLEPVELEVVSDVLRSLGGRFVRPGPMCTSRSCRE